MNSFSGREHCKNYMASLQELKQKLEPLFDADKGGSVGLSLEPVESYMVRWLVIEMIENSQWHIYYKLSEKVLD